MVAGAYQTGLLSYFTHRDLFPSLMKYIQDSEILQQVETPFALLGLLVNYNKFEFQNPYRMRLDDFVNEKVIQKIVADIGHVCARERDQYVALQEDLPEGWATGITNTLSSLTLGVFAGGSKQAPQSSSAEPVADGFTRLPSPHSAILLGTYDFANANKLFCFNLVVQSKVDAHHPYETPFAALLSLSSYLLQHSHRTTRTSAYAYLCLLVFRVILEDQVLCKRICDEEGKTSVRLCRQRQPNLPLIRTERIIASSILDLTIDGINHNLKRRLDVELYIALLGIIHRLISHLSRARKRLQYHWSELWRSLLSFIKFLTSYSATLKSLAHMHTLLDSLVNLIALSLSVGESFLPGPADYDDLFYKLVETGDILTKFRDAYDLQKRSESSLPTLIEVSKHYDELLQQSKSGRKSKQLNPTQVSSVIKQGYETLNISTKDGLDQYDKFREADHKSLLKKIARVAVVDVKNRFREEDRT
ncbi:MAG: hypothetical protein M1814_001799 [Vezdaea aestivalis]|nr:MAG: hypothetical protein M1814_001799 [Vezdaea aestivalis]